MLTAKEGEVERSRDRDIVLIGTCVSLVSIMHVYPVPSAMPRPTVVTASVIVFRSHIEGKAKSKQSCAPEMYRSRANTDLGEVCWVAGTGIIRLLGGPNGTTMKPVENRCRYAMENTLTKGLKGLMSR